MDLWQMLLRGLQFIWVLLITALIGNVIALNHSGHMVSINFAMFVAVLSWLAVIYGLVASIVEAVMIPIVLFVLDGLATLFTFIAAIVLSAKLGAPNCSHPHKSTAWIGWGASDTEKRCRELQASTAFMWFLWATFVATLVLALMSFRRVGGSARTSGPGMSQVGRV
ncbi:hypothetical protein DL546_004902 [Coniochaeta pulveracea]|uniref:MARVEL domain-containing protein n=1 Tax=Coniochaeta pulveracea TaxID=177199 RepID=A0A420Y928_9PEZI|nr:hypothetical protein DL546_004902 [Coniochaeta pulveracea]